MPGQQQSEAAQAFLDESTLSPARPEHKGDNVLKRMSSGFSSQWHTKII